MTRFEKSTYCYKSKRRSQAGLVKRIKEIAETRVRYGYRRIHVLLRREGWIVNPPREVRKQPMLDRIVLGAVRRVMRHADVQSRADPPVSARLP